MKKGALYRVLEDRPYGASLYAGDIVKIVDFDRMLTNGIEVELITGGRTWYINKENVEIFILNKGEKNNS